MTAMVDVMQPSAAAAAMAAATGSMAPAEFSCAACGEVFASAADQRAHCKSERHVYNTKRRLAGLKPISQEAWERKLRESRGATTEGKNKGTGHLKAGKEPKAKRGGGYEAAQAPVAPQDAAPEAAPEATAAEEPAPEPFAPENSLFDRKKFDSVDACLEYMWKTYSFQVPDREYCTDLPGLLAHLHAKINEPPHQCLFCNRRFPDAAACRRHMLDLGHSRIGTEARTRRGKQDDDGTEDLRAEIEAFYDFVGSTREITERMRDPMQKVSSLLRFFDNDHDGFLDFKELGAMWAATNDGATLTEATYKGACEIAGVDPAAGMDPKGLHRLYLEGFAELDAHFAMLQDALAQKLANRAKARREAAAAAAIEEEDEDEEEEEEDDDDGEEGEEEDDEDSDDTEILECDDEEEFEEVMRVLGLQPASVTDTGDLQLPNGRVVAHRDVAHIWKQRGTRMSQLVVAPGRAGGPKVRTPLMLTASGEGCTRLAMSARAQAKEGKKMVAILREQQRSDMRLGMKQNILQKKHGIKIRTTFGDASGGR